jgi:hypothetical protein
VSVPCAVCRVGIGRAELTPAHSFFAHLAGYAGFLDPAVHTLNHVRSHSTFLLCVILYVSARHHPTTAASPRLITVSDVLERHIQTKVWPNILLGDFKSVWICQGAMVWATFLPPARKGEDDIGWSLFAHASKCGLWAPGILTISPNHRRRYVG